MNTPEPAQGTGMPTREPYDHGGECADAPEKRIRNTRIVQSAAYLSIHGQMDREHYSEEYRKDVKEDFHFGSPALDISLGSGKAKR
jgi:hypothetical protein